MQKQKALFIVLVVLGLLFAADFWLNHTYRKRNLLICATFLHVLQAEWRKAGSPTGKELQAMLQNRGSSEYFAFTNMSTIGNEKVQFQFGVRNRNRLGTNGFVAVASDGRVFWIGTKTNDVYQIRPPAKR